MTKAEIMKLVEFDEHASWYRLGYDSERDPNTKLIINSARAENARLLPLIELLATSNEELVEVIEYILCYDQNSPERRRMSDALAAHEARMKEIEK